MKIKLLVLILSILLFFSSNSIAQICSINGGPRDITGLNYTHMHGDKLKAISADLPFIEDNGYKTRYAQFWVNAEVLNMRAGPGLEYEIISETYFGNRVFAFAKQGQWVAIRAEYNSEVSGIHAISLWVNINYLSAKRLNEQVDTDILKKKCRFEDYGTYSRKINKLTKQQLLQLSNTYDPCGEVRSYLSMQQLLNQPHNYVYEYEIWRKSQHNDLYSPAPCYSPRQYDQK